MSKAHKAYIEWQKELNELVSSSNLLGFDSNLIKEKKKIGEGGFGKVILCQYKSLQLAIKKIKKHDPKSLLNEVTILKNYQHPMIPSFYGLLKHPEFYDNIVTFNAKLLQENLESKKKGTKIHKQIEPDFDICLEYINGYSLEYILRTGKLNELEKYVILLNLATVLEYFHGFNVIHRDLKPENIMIDKSYKLKLLDFGISKIANDDKIINTVSIGTIMYMAPENFDLLTIVIDSDDESDSVKSEEEKTFVSNEQINRGSSIISDKVDIWAFGCILHEMFTGIRPWMNKVNNDKKIMALLYSKKPFEIDKKMPKTSKLRNLIQRCVEVDPNQRADILEVKTLLLEIFYERMKNLLNFKDGQINLAELTLKIYSLLPNMNTKEKFQIILKIQAYIFDYYRVLTAEKKGVPRFLFDYVKKNNKRKSIIPLLNTLVLREIDDYVEKEKTQKELISRIEKEETEKKKKILAERKNGKPLMVVKWHPDTKFYDKGEKRLRSPKQEIRAITIDSKKICLKKKLTLTNNYSEENLESSLKEQTKINVLSYLEKIGLSLKKEFDKILSKLFSIPINLKNLPRLNDQNNGLNQFSTQSDQQPFNTPSTNNYKIKNVYMKKVIKKRKDREREMECKEKVMLINDNNLNIPNSYNVCSTSDNHTLYPNQPFEQGKVNSQSNFNQEETALNPIVDSLTNKIYDEIKKNESQFSFNNKEVNNQSHNDKTFPKDESNHTLLYPTLPKTLDTNYNHSSSKNIIKYKYNNNDLKKVLEINISIDNNKHILIKIVDQRSNLISKIKRLNHSRNYLERKDTPKKIKEQIRILPENSPYLKKLLVSRGSEYNKISYNVITESNKLYSAKSEKNIEKKKELFDNHRENRQSPNAINSAKLIKEAEIEKDITRSISDVRIGILQKISNSSKDLQSNKSLILNEAKMDESKKMNNMISNQYSRDSSLRLKRENFNFYKFRANMNELLYQEKQKEIENIRKFSPLYNRFFKNINENTKSFNSQLEMYRNRIRNLKKNSNVIEIEDIVKKNSHINNYKEFKNYSNQKSNIKSLKFDFNIGKINLGSNISERKSSANNLLDNERVSLPKIFK